jgi:hypothetical protein
MSKPKKSHKRNQSKHRGRSAHPARVADIGLIIPDKMMTRMVYGEMIERTPSSQTDYYQFRLNSTFDPDLTGTGHKPLGRDQIAGTWYGKYRVHSVRAWVAFSNIMTGPCPCIHYMQPSNGYSINTITDVLEQPWMVFKVAGDPNYGFPLTLTGSWKLWDILGKPKDQYLADDVTGALINANPAENLYLTIGLGSMDRTTSVTKWRFAIRIEYEVEWYDRVLISAS